LVSLPYLTYGVYKYLLSKHVTLANVGVRYGCKLRRTEWSTGFLRLERLRRREEEERGGGGGEAEDTPHDSAESSVEGIFLSGVRPLHPFKVATAT
jgi:hypothetical protein